MSTFEQAMQASGLIPGAIVADGKWRRCKTTDKPLKKTARMCFTPMAEGTGAIGPLTTP